MIMTLKRRWFGTVLSFALVVAACGGKQSTPVSTATAKKPTNRLRCGGTKKMRVHYFNAGQALSVLVQLPDGRNVLVDTGESYDREGCGEACKTWSKRTLRQLKKVLSEQSTIDLLWITHQHSDHHGNAIKVLERYKVLTYVDNGTRNNYAPVKNIREKAVERGTRVWVTAPGKANTPLPPKDGVRVTPVVPKEWPVKCDNHPNECSIALRIDYCDSSILFVGDAEKHAEKVLKPGDINVLQVGHHGSATSSTDKFLERIRPEYAVISAAKKDEGTNAGYCHPRKVTVDALNKILGDKDGRKILAFHARKLSNGKNLKCKNATASDWKLIKSSRHLYSIPRDGRVILETVGDGKFHRAN